jgi:hypothetical protein
MPFSNIDNHDDIQSTTLLTLSPTANDDTIKVKPSNTSQPESTKSAMSTVKSLVNDNDNHQYYGNNDSDEDSVDSQCLISHMRSNNNSNVDQKSISGLSSSVRQVFSRYDEYHSFLTRSQRAALHPDPLPNPVEVQRRKVHFHSDETQLETVHEIECIPKDLLSQYYLTTEDFERIQQDAELTAFRWENHMSGKIPFDHVHNTLRGLESIVEVNDMDKHALIHQHQRDVLMEIHNQKISQRNQQTPRKIDWEQVRHVSLQHSTSMAHHARERALQDEQERHRIWDVNYGKAIVHSATTTTTPTTLDANKPRNKSMKKVMALLSFGRKTSR